MKLKHKILAIAVVAVAGINVYIANDMQEQRNNLSLMNLENIAEGFEWWDNFTEWVGEVWDATKWVCQDAVCTTTLTGQPLEGTKAVQDPNGGHLPICTCGLIVAGQTMGL